MRTARGISEMYGFATVARASQFLHEEVLRSEEFPLLVKTLRFCKLPYCFKLMAVCVTSSNVVTAFALA